MSKKYDFSELLAESQRLTNQTSDAKRLKRNVLELEKASFSLSEKDKISTRGNRAELAAYRLLSQRAYDAEGLRREINNIQLKTQLDPSERLESTDIEGYLQHHQDLIIWTAIGGSRRSAEENVLALQRNWTHSNWAAARKNFTESLGRLPQDGLYDGPSMNINFSGGVSGSLPYASTPGRTGLGDRNVFTPASANPGSTALQALNPTHHSTSSGNKVHNSTLKSHTDVVTRMNDWIKSNENFWDSLRPITQLKQVLSTPQAAVDMKNLGIEKHGFNGYSICLDILCTMVDETSQAPPKKPGYYSPISFKTSEGTGDYRSMELARNSRTYFERHYMNYMDLQIERETGRHHVVPAEEALVRLSRTKQFVKLQISNRVLSLNPNGVLTNDDIPLWPVIYYCIRIGDVYSAQQELKHCLSRSISNGVVLGQVKCVLDLLEYVSLYMHESTSTAAADLSNLPHSLQECRSILIHSDSHTTDPYLRQILNLLSLGNHEENFDIKETLEDFLWVKLWFITWSQTLNTLGTNVTSVLPDSSNNTSESILDMSTFANMMMDDNEYGSDFFDKGNAKPFQYAEVLIVSQQFGEAILYLWEKKQIVASIHLMCVCLYYGLILPHESLSSSLQDGGGLGSTTPRNLMRHWIENDIKGSFGFDLGVCAQYILILNSNWKTHLVGIVDANEIDFQDKKSSSLMSNALIQLIKSSSLDQIKILVGDMNKSGVRESGLLDTYFSQRSSANNGINMNDGNNGEDEINALIVSAASECNEEDPDDVKPFYLYQLGGQYGYACHVACEQLSGVIFMNWNMSNNGNTSVAYKSNGDKGNNRYNDPTRDAIRKRCSDFYRKLESRAGIIAQSILNTNHEILMDVLFKLLEIGDALDFFTNGDYEQSKLKLKNSGLFPFHEIDVNSAADLYVKYPDFLHRIGDNTIIMLMTCFKEEFKRVRASMSSGGREAGRLGGMFNNSNNVSPLESIKAQADAIVLFCDRIKSKLKRSNTLAIINAMKDEFYR